VRFRRDLAGALLPKRATSSPPRPAATPRSRALERVRRPRLAALTIHRVGSCGDDRSRDGRACEVSRSNPELRPRRHERACGLRPRRKHPNDPVRARWCSSGKRSCAAVSGDPIRAAAEGRAITRRQWCDANNRMYGPIIGSASPPSHASCAGDVCYGAARATMYDVEYFTQLQLDVLIAFRNAISAPTSRRRSAIASAT